MQVRLSLVPLLLAVLLILPSCVSPPHTARVLRVIDGDTIVISGQYRVRYIGIDAPEVGEPYYEEATEYNRYLVGGKTVEMETDVTDKDRYGRLLRYVYVDGTFVNAELVRQGYATVYPRDRFPDNRYHDRLLEAQSEAQAARKGIWAAD